MSRSTSLIEPERIHVRRGADEESDRPGIVLYWMQQAQRAQDNPALEYAVQQANERGETLAVLFCVVADYPEASARHFTFMLQGLSKTASALERRGICFEALVGEPADVIGELAHRIGLLVIDAGFLPLQRQWRDDVAAAYDGPIHEVEADVVVPTHLVSDKQETAARTIRPKINEYLDEFIVDLRTTALDITSVSGGDSPMSLSRTAGSFDRLDLGDGSRGDVAAAVGSLPVAATPGPVEGWVGGTSQALARLDDFCASVLGEYSTRRNRYDRSDGSSKLSPYLHYGQISPVRIAHQVRAAGVDNEQSDALIEELVVRRELAVNFVLHGDAFDRFSGLPGWAKDTLREHADDERRGVVTASDLEQGNTGDEVWNAIMGVIRRDGWVHNQLRMYWGKQILYWTNTPDHAFRTLLELNNRWFLDGRDPNSYANVAWCFGRHDQGFQERDVIGKVRPFTTAALKRKGDLDAWLESVS